MIDDDIVREVRQAREAFAAEHGFNIRAMMAALRALDDAGDSEVVSFAPRPVEVESSMTKFPACEQDRPTPVVRQ